MNKLIIIGILALAVGLSAPPTAHAQGTTYISNLGETPSGSLPVGSDSWAAVLFRTGTNSGGYFLNSFQLAMMNASGDPSGFSVMLYNNVGTAGPQPGSSLASLTGSSSPSTAGIYIYTPATDLMLSAMTSYYVVLTAGTPVANGAYEWSDAGTFSYNLSGGWNTSPCERSTDGSSWFYNWHIDPVFAINASPVPEPSTAAVVGLGLLALVLRRRGTYA
jgi:hypothetical protein